MSADLAVAFDGGGAFLQTGSFQNCIFSVFFLDLQHGSLEPFFFFLFFSNSYLLVAIFRSFPDEKGGGYPAALSVITAICSIGSEGVQLRSADRAMHFASHIAHM